MIRLGTAGNRATFANVANNYNLAGGNKNFEIRENGILINDLATFTIASAQFVWSGLTGTLDAEVKTQGSMDGDTWDDLGLYRILNTASGSVTLSDSSFPHLHFRACVTVNGVTGGILTINILAKD